MDPFIGEIRIFGGTFAPEYWAFCDGQLLSIAQNNSLFYLIGTTYGGDGQTTFALPDLRGRVPMHRSSTYTIGQLAGVESVTLLANQIGAHTHAVQANTEPGTENSPSNMVWAAPANAARYSSGSPSLAMRNTLVGNAGGSQPHDNMMPFMAVNFIICLAGIYPTRD